MISVLIPVKNGGDDLARCLEAIGAQEVDDDVEVVVVDSGSTDGSVDRARELGATVHEIPPAEFVHGATRNLAAGRSRGEVLVFTTQDAVPADRAVACTPHGRARDRRRRRCVRASAPSRERDTAGAVLSRVHVRGCARTQRIGGIDELTFEQTLFSNVNSAIPRAVWEANPFRDDVTMSEDQEWSRRMLLAGHTIVYVPTAAVRHSHAYTLRGAFKRFYDSGASADRSYVAGDESRAAIRRALKRYATGELRWLWTTGAAPVDPLCGRLRAGQARRTSARAAQEVRQAGRRVSSCCNRRWMRTPRSASTP